MGRIAPRTFALSAKNGRPATSVEVRTTLPEDAPLFEPFWRQAVSESTHTLQTPEFPPDFGKIQDQWQKMLEDPREVRIGAFAPDGRIVGQLGFYAVFGAHPWRRHLGSFGMIVLEEYWGRGIGRVLLATMEEFAKSNGYLKIEAEVRVENERGVEFYQSAGYAISGTRTRAAKIDGRFQDEYWIAKDLDSGR
jgi:putative acetyltransferase